MGRSRRAARRRTVLRDRAEGRGHGTTGRRAVSRRRAVVAVLALAAATGCGGQAPEDEQDPASATGASSAVTPPAAGSPPPSASPGRPATERTEGTWELTDPATVSPADREVEIEVRRLGCAGGKTGEIAEPEVTLEEDRILIRADVEPLPDGRAHTCPLNDVVPVTVPLGERIGERRLVDEACLGGRAADTTWCTDPVRWTASGPEPR